MTASQRPIAYLKYIRTLLTPENETLTYASKLAINISASMNINDY